MGGLFGLAMGLRTNINNGLSPHETRLTTKKTLEQVLVAVRENTKTQDEIQEAQKRRTEGDYSVFETVDDDTPTMDSRPTSLARTFSLITSDHAPVPFEDRRRIFSSNSIPIRKRKNIFQLMWAAFKDKILVDYPVCTLFV